MQQDIVRVGFGVILIKDQTILLGKRHDDPMKAGTHFSGEGTWTMPGGKLEFGESFEAGVVREVMEETSIIVEASKLVNVVNSVGETSHFVTLGFLATQFRGEAQVTEPDEIVQWQWFPLDALPSPLFYPTQQVLELYLQRKFYTDSMR